jgi:hypothetical protein
MGKFDKKSFQNRPADLRKLRWQNARIVSFITESNTIRRILDHLKQRTSTSRAPPGSTLSHHLF